MPSKTSTPKKRPSSPQRTFTRQRPGFSRLAEAQTLLDDLYKEMADVDSDLQHKARAMEHTVGKVAQSVEETLVICRQVLLAGLAADAWLPATFFEPAFVSRATLTKWIREGLERKYVCQKLCVRPKDFFARVDLEASSETPASAGNLKPMKTSE